MATTHSNSSYKVKFGTVKTLVGLVPEVGAAIVLETPGPPFNHPYWSDGITWQPFGGGVIIQAPDSLALRLLAPVSLAMTTGTPQQLPFFDTVVYNNGTSFTPNVPNDVAVNNTDSYQTSIGVNVRSSRPFTNVTIQVMVNGTQRYINTMLLDRAGVNYSQTRVVGLNLSAGDVVTVEITASKNCNLLFTGLTLGMQNVS